MSFISAAQIRAQRSQSSDSPLFFRGGDQGVVADAHASDAGKRDDQVSHHPQTPSSGSKADPKGLQEGAIVPQTHFTDTTATSSLGHHTVFTPQAQAAFLEHLSLNGNVRLACRAAAVSPQTAYRARRRSSGFAGAWDAACVSARGVAEEALADRAINGWEEAVFYHGEEVARRRRFSDRLLLAHLARLDKLAEREGAREGLVVLDDQIEALGRGEELPEPVEPQSDEGEPDILDQDPVPSVPSWRIPPSSSPKKEDAVGQQKPCPDCGGQCDDPNADLGPEDCQWLGNRRDHGSAAFTRVATRVTDSTRILYGLDVSIRNRHIVGIILIGKTYQIRDRLGNWAVSLRMAPA